MPRLFRPRLRWRLTFSQSSIAPTSPVPIDRQDDEPARARERRARADVAEDVAGQQGCQHGDAAHRRGPLLGGVLGGAVLADVLADPPADEPPEQQRSAEAGDEDGDAGGGEQRDHRVAASLAASETTTSRSSKSIELVADLLGPLMALAGHEHECRSRGHLGGAGKGKAIARRRSGSTISSDSPPAPRSHVLDDLERILVAGIVGGDDAEIGESGGGGSHEGALGPVTVAAGPEHDDQQAVARQPPQRREHLAQRPRLVGVVDDDGDAEGVLDALEASRRPVRRREALGDGAGVHPELPCRSSSRDGVANVQLAE